MLFADMISHGRDRQVCAALKRGMQNNLLQQVKVQKLPPPDAEEMERVRGLPLQEFHRIAVAYGLTVAANFEEHLIWPKDIKPLAKSSETGMSKAKYEDRYISKDMV